MFAPNEKPRAAVTACAPQQLRKDERRRKGPTGEADRVRLLAALGFEDVDEAKRRKATLAAAKAAPLFTSAAPAVKYPNVRPQPPGQAPGGSGYTAAAVPHARAKGQRIHVRRPHQTTSHHAAP